jgi:hypothetical protein
MGTTQQNKVTLVAIAVVLAVAILLVDLSLPLGVAGGVPYVALVLLGWWLEKPRHIFWLAAVSSALTVAGYFSSPEGGIQWVVLTNRFLGLLAVWVTAVLLAMIKRAQMAVQTAHNELNQHVEAALRESEERFRTIIRPPRSTSRTKTGATFWSIGRPRSCSA